MRVDSPGSSPAGRPAGTDSAERLAFGPLLVGLTGGEAAGGVAAMFADAAAGGGPCDVVLDVAAGPPRPREWSASNPGGYTVDREAARISIAVADWTATFDLGARRTRVEFRELWFPAVEQFFRVFVQTWLPLTGKGLTFHAAAVVYDGRCLMFPARAETGKTTVARTVHEHGGSVITEEMACCEVGRDGVTVHSLPFRDRSGLTSPRRLVVPLDHVYSLRQGSTNRVHAVPAARKVLLLARNAAVGFREPELMLPAMPLCAALARTVPVDLLEFTLGSGFLSVV